MWDCLLTNCVQQFNRKGRTVILWQSSLFYQYNSNCNWYLWPSNIPILRNFKPEIARRNTVQQIWPPGHGNLDRKSLSVGLLKSQSIAEKVDQFLPSSQYFRALVLCSWTVNRLAFAGQTGSPSREFQGPLVTKPWIAECWPVKQIPPPWIPWPLFTEPWIAGRWPVKLKILRKSSKTFLTELWIAGR